MAFVKNVRHIFWPKIPWSRRRVALVSVAAILCALAFTELSHANISNISTFLFSNLDSSTEGKVLDAKTWTNKTSRGSRRHFYGVWYSYEVDNNNYVGNLIHLGPHIVDKYWLSYSEQESLAKAAVETYPLGTKVVVYYDSRTPSFSLLDKSGSGWTMVANTTFMIISIPIMIWIFARFAA